MNVLATIGSQCALSVNKLSNFVKSSAKEPPIMNIPIVDTFPGTPSPPIKT